MREAGGMSWARCGFGVARSGIRRATSLGVVAALLMGIVGAIATAQTASAATPKPFSVTITRIVQPDDSIDPGPLQGSYGDFYAGVAIDANPRQDNFPKRLNNGLGGGSDFPATFNLNANDWTFTRDIDPAAGDVSVDIEIWDNDDCDKPFCNDTGIFENDDDMADVSPGSGRILSLTVDPTTGRWSGDVAWPQNCAEGAESDHVKVCFEISVDSANGDVDGDGLLDSWERNGFNADGDSTIDVNLPAFGASPYHKDLFLELDYEAGQSPTRVDILAMKAAFRAAPLPNPDGRNGVNLWVDTGNLVDVSAREGQPLGTCNDGIDNGASGTVDGADTDCTFLDASVEDPQPANCGDNGDNDGDGAVDANDPDCLVGDNLGGGSAVPMIGACNLDSTWYAAKRQNFNSAQRGWIFRYATSLALGAACPASGGWGEIGGNDFMDFNHDGGTLLHELGHTLNLRHGGNEDNNCKPNYVSAMNYDNQLGINRVGGGTILDFSPPRVALNGSTRGMAPLAPLAENPLSDGTVLDATDPSNRFIFTNPAGSKVQFALNQGANWNSDADPPLEGNLSINLDTNATGGGPAACNNASLNDSLEGFHDWNAISIPFRQFGDSADGAINPVTTQEPTITELRQLRDDLNKTDLSVTVSDSADPVAAGTQLTYTATVVNNGPNPATSVQLVDMLPAEVTFASATAGCAAAGSAVTCNFGEIPVNASRTVQVVVNVPANLVYVNGGPKTITNTVQVANLRGPDASPSDNVDSEPTLVIAVADVSINSVTPSPPLEVLMGQPSPASLSVVMQNAGPSSPIDVRLTSTASSSAGVTVSPATQTTGHAALAVGAPATMQQTFTLACTSPGQKTVSFDYQLALANGADVDPVPANNVGRASVTIDCVVPIAINIRPDEFPNKVSMKDHVGVVLAALTTKAGEYGLPMAFDAKTIDISTVRFGLRANLFNVASATGVGEAHGKVHLEDSVELNERSKDKDLDGIMHFPTDASGLAIGSTEACVKGKFITKEGTFTFLGCDSVVVKP